MSKKYLTRIISFGLSMIAVLAVSTGCSNKQKYSQTAEAPASDQPTAVISIKDYGEVKVMLFPSEAPKSVENFIALAKKGYYDGLKFHRVLDQFMIQGGDPTGTGSGGESKWGGAYQEKPSKNLYHYSGALCFAQTQSGDITSQFYIVNSDPLTDETISLYKSQYGIDISKDAQTWYKKLGGAPSLDGNYTVFGQVYEGLDIIKKVMQTEVKANDMGEKSSPVNDVIIESIKITNE